MKQKYQYHPCCGLSNLIGAVVIGILQIVLSTILIATYSTALKFVSLGKHAMLLRLQTEAGMDFIKSLGLDSSKDRVLVTTLILYLVIYFLKILLGIHLLTAVRVDSIKHVRANVCLHSTIFLIRLVLHIISVLLVHNLAVGIIVVYSFSMAVEMFFIWVILLLCRDMRSPSWGISNKLPEGLRLSSRNMYAKQIVMNSKHLLISVPMSVGAKCP